jgi:SAGA-associated factor 29
MGNPGERYTASATQLIAIASADADLPDYPVGKAVLARYPETTTFYRAEVTGTARKGVCKLRFEDDQNQEMEVARRFVLNLDK